MTKRWRQLPKPSPRVLGLGLCLLLLFGMQSAAYEIDRQVVSSGAVNSQGGGYQMRGSVGQPGGGLISDATHQHGVGYWYLIWNPFATAVEDLPGIAPLRDRLDQNVPNPFNPRTTIHFSLAREGHVQLNLYDVRGRLVAELINGSLEAGEHSLVFNGEQLPSGVYLYQLRSGDFTQSRRFTLVK